MTISKVIDLLQGNLKTQNQQILINQGIILSRMNQQLDSKNIQKYEFKVFSQNGEDGIIQHLIANTKIINQAIKQGRKNNLSEDKLFWHLVDNL